VAPTPALPIAKPLITSVIPKRAEAPHKVVQPPPPVKEEKKQQTLFSSKPPVAKIEEDQVMVASKIEPKEEPIVVVPNKESKVK
jgi:hypothetical protein